LDFAARRVGADQRQPGIKQQGNARILREARYRVELPTTTRPQQHRSSRKTDWCDQQVVERLVVSSDSLTPRQRTTHVELLQQANFLANIYVGTGTLSSSRVYSHAAERRHDGLHSLLRDAGRPWRIRNVLIVRVRDAGVGCAGAQKFHHAIHKLVPQSRL
jgi:hypothetical protein